MIYLTEKRSMSNEMAKEVFNLFGGRMKSLQSVASKLESGLAFSGRASILTLAMR
jgi:hypothetical protein